MIFSTDDSNPYKFTVLPNLSPSISKSTSAVTFCRRRFTSSHRLQQSLSSPAVAFTSSSNILAIALSGFSRAAMNPGERLNSRPAEKTKSKPLLLFLHEKFKDINHQKEEFQTIFDITEKKFYTEKNWQMQKYRCFPTVQGWIFMLGQYGKCCLFNFFSKKYVLLPHLDWNGSFEDDCTCVLSSSPLNTNCVVLFANLEHNSLHFCRINEGKKWLTHEPNLDHADEVINSVTFCYPKFYGLTNLNNFFAIDYTPEPKITILETMDLERPIGFNCLTKFLMESQGEIYCINVFWAEEGKIANISMWKRDNTAGTWNIVNCIGDRIILLGEDNFAAPWIGEEIGYKENCIYLIQNRSKNMDCFDIKEGTMASSTPCPHVQSRFSLPIWILPSS